MSETRKYGRETVSKWITTFGLLAISLLPFAVLPNVGTNNIVDPLVTNDGAIARPAPLLPMDMTAPDAIRNQVVTPYQSGTPDLNGNPILTGTPHPNSD